jgi:hypothetical protein
VQVVDKYETVYTGRTKKRYAGNSFLSSITNYGIQIILRNLTQFSLCRVMMPKLIDVEDFVVLPFYKLPEMPLTPTEGICIPAH